MTRPQRLALLGATGSIGRQVCEIVQRYPERFTLHAMVAGRDGAALHDLAAAHPSAHTRLATPGEGDPEAAAAAIDDLVRDPEVDLVVVAIAGSAALRPTLAALEAGKDVALATKEVLVMAGDLVRQRMRRHGSRLLPIDSEHSAIWQCLWGEQRASVRRLILTGSGGPFLRRPMETLPAATVGEALQHPRWKMGPKITIDSATMMNKGLEMIEAHYLFDVAYPDIEVVIHPEAVVHSMVEFVDGSVKAQLGVPDMRLPIAVALAYPNRIPDIVQPPDLTAIKTLTFEPVDPQRFPAVALARTAAQQGSVASAVLNAANEEAVAAFLEGRLGFSGIVSTVQEAVAREPGSRAEDLEAILGADRRARQFVRKVTGPDSDILERRLPA
jgi:1-deoxy-D-xylulose-5-phosphate reductoisomerase